MIYLLSRWAFLIACACCYVLQASSAFSQPFGLPAQPTAQTKTQVSLSTQEGRYVFGQISESAKDQFMLDTVTGRLWRVSESGKVGLYLKPVPYCDEKGDCTPLPPK
ncbi:MAG: hypothetical protein COZ70_05865 [Deltaproteobacteria bacterium CG_4_8_14_3_um_filter_51_11]|nr:hypothetical protein [bacterium]OIP42329.1 MAG: hypothetical protein AUK25_04190 [Desulfobacteraceae bacterium CG2_30_51_40]PIP45764.1 MAG: hypothetical protein COX16_11555 [Deltaproteobacteria bacterium CG23_combo_of_CG06-09_8_20_14_all_51_20]PIX20024.1 MAG: hypothetical protein COZ70_05865 [Deltaproteobacteria bacterium CG_4_8_14_3_um_filter_51_11]PJB38643.1 MAG: hypothetical protein CO107_01815 [Deltaproteobacteria bacterium CG_4_9_14_3_um_filter_51_14]